MPQWLVVLGAVVGLLVKYGPELYRMGRGVYAEVERLRYRRDPLKRVPSKRKRREFNVRFLMALNEENLRRAGRMEGLLVTPMPLEGFREGIWRRENPGKKPRDKGVASAEEVFQELEVIAVA